MSVAIVTGAAGLVGSEAVRYFAQLGFEVVGIDNDLRAHFFGSAASTSWNRRRLEKEVAGYRHEAIDIRDQSAIHGLFARFGRDIGLIVHAAAQPSHDWAAQSVMDFDVNARGTLILLQATREHCAAARFIYMSTNKVYGDRPNQLPLVENETRWEITADHPFAKGIDETMSVDATLHSLFGVSKLSADLMVQEFGRYFGMPTVCIRGGCLTGPNHAGAQLHGFLAFLMHCALTRTCYTVFGYAGKQVRDNLHSYDLVRAFDEFRKSPRCGEVYNLGGSRFSNCSMIEAIRLCEEISQEKMEIMYTDQHRIGDHQWWISDVTKFQRHYPNWTLKWDLTKILTEMATAQKDRLACVAV